MEMIMVFLASKGLLVSGVGLFGALLNFVLKRYITTAHMNWLGNRCEQFGYGWGVVLTGGLSKWTYTARIWNVFLEPYVVIIIDKLALFITGFIRGLRSDNPDLSDE